MMFDNDFGEVIKPFVNYDVLKSINGLFMVSATIGKTTYYSKRFDLYEAFETLNHQINEKLNSKEEV